MMVMKSKIKDIKLELSRWVSEGGDGRVFAVTFMMPMSCGKHAVCESAHFKNGPETCPEMNMTTDKFGREWIDAKKIISYLDEHVNDDHSCDR